MTKSALIGIAIGLVLTALASGQESISAKPADQSASINILSWRNGGQGDFSNGGPFPDRLSDLSVKWKTRLPHRSNASPILVEDRIFVCAEPNLILCLALDSGELLWQKSTSYLHLKSIAGLTESVRANLSEIESRQLRQFGRTGLNLAHHPQMLSDPDGLPEQFRRPPVHLDAGFTTPTPVSDGKFVYVAYGTGLVSGFTLDGNRRWCVYPEKPTIRWGHSSSPVIARDKLIIHTDHCIALDLETGNEIWRTQARKRWPTPAIIRLRDDDLIVLGGGELIRASDGTILADLFPHDERCDPYVNYWGTSSPITDGHTVYFVDATPIAPGVAPTIQRFDLSFDGNQRVVHSRRWIAKIPNGKYYASPIVYDGRLYVVASTIRTKGDRDFESILNRRCDGTLLVVDAESGSLFSGIELGRETGTYHTLSIADNRLWVTGHTGIFLSINLEGAIQETSRLNIGPTRSGPLFFGRDIVLRCAEDILRLRVKRQK